MHRTATFRLALLLVLAFLALPAGAQNGGAVLWTLNIDGFSSTSQPAVAPDGTIYVHTNTFYAISPDGEILWTRALPDPNAIDVAADGTVYAASDNTIYAFEPDGTLKWSFTESPLGQGVMAGPTIGPDGNIYAVTDLGGMGALALTPNGELLWNVPGFGDFEGTGRGHVQFGPNNLYVAEDVMPRVGTCAELNTGLASVTLDGQLDWCQAISGTSLPVATQEGLALIWQEGLSGRTLFAYDASGQVVWTYPFELTPTGINSVSVGGDGNIYLWHNATTQASLTPSGSLRWERSQNVGLFGWRPVLSPDFQTLVSGIPYGFGENGEILATDPANGSPQWVTPVVGPSAGADAPAAFSPDGQVVYVAVGTVSFDDPNQLWALQVGDAPPPSGDLTVSTTPLSEPVTVSSSGGSFQYDVTFTNEGASTRSFDAWVVIDGPGVSRTIGPRALTLGAGQTLATRLTQQVPGGAPAGTYTQTLYAGTLPISETSDSFTWEKLIGTSSVSTSTASGWGTLDGLMATTTSVAGEEQPAQYALAGNYPNPFNPQTTIRYALPEASVVRLAVYDVLGREVAVLVDGRQAAGTHEVAFDASGLPSGAYLYRLEAGPHSLTRKLTLLR